MWQGKYVRRRPLGTFARVDQIEKSSQNSKRHRDSHSCESVWSSSSTEQRSVEHSYRQRKIKIDRVQVGTDGEGGGGEQVVDAHKARRKQIELLEHEISQLQRALNHCETSLMDEKECTAELQSQVESLATDLSLFRGDAAMISECSMDECCLLIDELNQSLQAFQSRKIALLEADLDSCRQVRLCAVCWEKDKSIVLLPCRHYCLCGACAESDNIRSCPICRQTISDKFHLYG